MRWHSAQARLARPKGWPSVGAVGAADPASAAVPPEKKVKFSSHPYNLVKRSTPEKKGRGPQKKKRLNFPAHFSITPPQHLSVSLVPLNTSEIGMRVSVSASGVPQHPRHDCSCVCSFVEALLLQQRGVIHCCEAPAPEREREQSSRVRAGAVCGQCRGAAARLDSWTFRAALLSSP